jgi:DNA-binding NarL/FixJ family response regulator
MTNPCSENNQPIPTVIVSRPGVMQQSLRASLAACPEIIVIATSGDGLSALRQVRQHQPRLLVIDSNLLEEETAALLNAVKSEQPNICCLVFIHAHHQKRQMLDAGADEVALRNDSSRQLQSTLDRLARMANEP